MEANIKWEENMTFSGITISGQKVKMDAAEEVGGNNSGARPTELLLYGLAGCTGIDIISILNKMRLNPTSFEMDVKGERADEHPKRFTNIHIHYALQGDLPEQKVIRAIQLSKDKYCSVSHSLNAEITASYSINGVKGENNL
ncbi:OsmC family protein [Niallia sp. Krafla_26]|uniref:OsmC family protein n=1 Tax=Niallia sp. Krafla_26 TaxID=3064703 RepID=UPI003D16F82E